VANSEQTLSPTVHVGGHQNAVKALENANGAILGGHPQRAAREASAL